MATGLTALFALSALIWLGLWIRNVRDLRETPWLRPGDGLPADAPSVSVLVPCRNEASRILATSLRSLLAQRYPRFEVIAVNDRSTDDTLAVLRALAAEDPRLRVIDGVEPPPGWLGKAHALHQALAVADGEWVLGTDADIVFHPDALSAAIRAGRERGADVVTLIPGSRPVGPAVDTVMPVAVWMILLLYPPRATNRSDDPRALGCGGFLMVRREALLAVGGYERIRDDLADDVGLAQALKADGRRLFCAFAPDLLFTPMYESLAEVWAGFGKNALRGVDYSLWRGAVALAELALGAVLHAPAALALTAAAVAGAGPAWHPPCLAAWAAWAAWAAQAAALRPVYRSYRVSPGLCLAAPFGFAFMAAVLASAMGRKLARREVSWRGRGVSPPQRRPLPEDQQGAGGRHG